MHYIDIKNYDKLEIVVHVSIIRIMYKLKGTWILFQHLFLMENSILYAKIAVSEKNCFSKTQF